MTDDVRAAINCVCGWPESMHDGKGDSGTVVCTNFRAAKPTVTIDAELLDEVLKALGELCYLTHRRFCDTCGKWDCEVHGYCDLLARVKTRRGNHGPVD